MKYLILLYIFLTCGFYSVAQTRSKLEEQRKKTLEEIAYVNNLLQETEKRKNIGINDLKIINNNIELRENIIDGLSKEARILLERIELNNLALKLMEEDLFKLKEEYKKAILRSYKESKGYPEIIYILSAKDFNQGYKRIKYLQQLSKNRRNEAEIIGELKVEMEKIKAKLDSDFLELEEIKRNEENQKLILIEEKKKKNIMVRNLMKKERQLKQELEEKKKIAQRIENEILKLIDEEKKKSNKGKMTPEMKLIGSNFEENKGRLPWPVEKGIITGNYGLQKHKELVFVTENNPGIEITSYGETKVRSVFKGEVARVLSITGANMAVIIRHGNYFTVYQNLVNVRVKAGDKIETKEIIGDVYLDKERQGKSILKFMIFKEKIKLNPEEWIAK